MNLSVNFLLNRLDEEVLRVGILNISIELLQKKEFVSVFYFEFLLFLVYVFFFLFFGVIGNILICCVYNWKWERKCKVFFLFILIFVWVDLLNCLFMMFFEIVLLVNIILFDYLIFCKIFCWLIYYLNCFFIMILFGIVLD